MHPALTRIACGYCPCTLCGNCVNSYAAKLAAERVTTPSWADTPTSEASNCGSQLSRHATESFRRWSMIVRAVLIVISVEAMRPTP
jgi:hypothetical protein